MLRALLLALAAWGQIGPPPVDFYLKQGDERLAAKDPEGAVRAYTLAVDAWTADMGFAKRATANYKRAIAHAHAGALDKALEDLTVAHELEPRSPEILVARGVVHFRRKASSKAGQDAARALALDKGLVSAHVLRACALDRQKEHKAAARAAAAALKLEPQSVGALIARGLAYYHAGQLAKALVDLDRALELDPNNPRGYFWRALAYKKRKMRDSQKLDEETLKRLRPDFDAQLKRKGASYLYPLPFAD